MKFSPCLLAVACALLLSTVAVQPATAQPATPAGSTAAEELRAGQLAAAGWLMLLDRHDWGRAWDVASAEFRSSVPLAAWMDSIPKSREGLGAFVQRTPAGSEKTTLDGRPGGNYVSVVFVSKFDKKEIRELVTTVREADGKWRVTGYSPQ